MLTIKQLVPIVIEELDKNPFKPSERKRVIVTIENFKIKSRKREFVEVRQFCCLFLREYTKLSFPEIGENIGDYNHTTVMNLIKNFNNLIINEPRLKEIYDNINLRVKKIINISTTTTFIELVEFYKTKAIEKDIEQFIFTYENFYFIVRLKNYQWTDPELIELL